MGKHSDFRISSFHKSSIDAWRILQYFNRKMEKYFKEFIWFWGMLSEWHLYGSLTVFQESWLDPRSTLEHQTGSTNQSQHDLLYGGVSLLITGSNLNLKLAPVPFATPKWPVSSWSGVLYCWACSEQFVSMLFEEKHWPSLFLPQTWMGIIFLTRICIIMCSEQCAILVQIYIFCL